MPDLNRNTGHPLKTESQINNKYFFIISVSYEIYGTHFKELVIVYRKFKVNWCPLFSDNS